jgi:hypothetical protein
MIKIDLEALAELAGRLRDTRSWLAAFDYPGVGTAMATCEASANAIDNLIDLARGAAIPSKRGEPVAWSFELAQARNQQTGEWVHFGPPQLSFTKPNVPDDSIRNLTPLAPVAGVKVKPPKWHHEVAIGASTEEWFATTPEGQSLIVTYDESCELPWVARPFPPGASNYATADEAKAALEAAREARILSALDQGELK